jgi:hypothetical protein
MTEQSVHLTPLRERVETKIKRHLNKMYSGERAELTFEQDFHGDHIDVVVTKGHRLDEIAYFRVAFRTREAGRYDGFNSKRDLTWTIDAVLSDLGL